MAETKISSTLLIYVACLQISTHIEQFLGAPDQKARTNLMSEIAKIDGLSLQRAETQKNVQHKAVNRDIRVLVQLSKNKGSHMDVLTEYTVSGFPPEGTIHELIDRLIKQHAYPPALVETHQLKLGQVVLAPARTFKSYLEDAGNLVSSLLTFLPKPVARLHSHDDMNA